MCGSWFAGCTWRWAFFVVPVERRSVDLERAATVPRRFAYGTLAVLVVLFATGSAMATHLDLLGDGTFRIKLALVLLVRHVCRPTLHALKGLIFLVSLAIVRIGLYPANGYS